MGATVILGAQWGDEGKGKEVDIIAENMDVIVRYNGGANAGHTLVVGEKKYVTHLLPSGIVRSGKLNIVGPMVVCDLEVIRDELAIANAHGSQVMLDRSAPVVLPIHKLIDGGREGRAGSAAIGTTKRGIGPAYEDFWGRRGLKLGDLVSRDRIAAALKDRGFYDERLVVLQHLGVVGPSFDETVAWCESFSDLIRPLLADTRNEVVCRLMVNYRVLFEGAQGVMLDTVHGSQPFTTSSLCTTAGVSASYGIYQFDRVIGVTKAYATRVGAGPFPTEQENEVGERLRMKGGEFGATTGRPRRCGWLDLVALSYACRLGGITELVVTKLDVLTGFETIKVCRDYEFEGHLLGSYETLTSRVLREAKPGYESLSGWQKDISTCRQDHELPPGVGGYLSYISMMTSTPITSVGVGPDRSQTIVFRRR